MSYADFKLSYQISPIILTYGIAGAAPGGMVPIISLTESNNFDFGLLSSGGPDLAPDDFFAQFEPLAGATLQENAIGEYPFANQATAGNAVIADPLVVSLRMHCPVRQPGGYAAKLATMTALKSSLDQHIGAGGTFTVATPSYIYTNCILLRLVDVSEGVGDTKQVQTTWQWDFRKPLLTEEDAAGAQNSLMGKINSQTVLAKNADGGVAWSGLAPTVNNPSSLAASSLYPAASGPAGASASGAQSSRIGSFG